MEEEEFLKKFIDYTNKSLEKEGEKINSEYNLKKAKFIVVLNDLSDEEIERAYKSLIRNISEQRLSLDYVTPEMVSILKEPGFEKKKDKRKSLVITSVTSRKPKVAIQKLATEKLNNEESLKTFKYELASYFNNCYKMHKDKPNTYDDFEFSITDESLLDKKMFKDKLVEEAKNLQYKIHQLNPDLLDITKLVDNNYLVRYSYGQ